MTKTLNQIIFFLPPPKSEYVFQHHWESELNGRSLIHHNTQQSIMDFLNHNTGTILEKKIIPVLCTILVYQYCDRQVQEILIKP